MFTIIGLGNPGGEYEKTRHNAGRILAALLAEKADADLKEKKTPPHWAGTGELYGERVRFVLPDTFMNKSGKAALPYAKTPKAAKTLVVLHDELDMPLGAIKISVGRSAGGHNGVDSIMKAVKSKEFVRIRVGVSKASRGKAKKPVGEKAVHDFLLGAFTKGELEKLEGPVRKRVEEALEAILTTKDPIMGMNAVNGLPPL